MHRTETLELLIVLNLAITLSAVFYMLNPAAGFFGAISIAFINNAILHSNGNILLYSAIDSSTIPGDIVYMYAFHLLSGISFDTMMRIPVNHTLIGVSLFCLGRELTKSRQTLSGMSIAATVSFLFLLNWSYVIEDMSFFVKGAGTFLFLVFLLLLLKYRLARRTSTLTGLLILFVANGFFDYTAQAWMIIAVIPFMVIGGTSSDRGKVARFWNLFILMVVVFLAYRSILYTAYLPWIGQLLIGSSLQTFVHSLPLFRDVTSHPFQGNNPSTFFVFIANVVTFAATSTVTAYYLLRISWIRARGKLPAIEDIVFISLFLPLPLTIAIYLPIGVFNLSYATLMLPLLSAYGIWTLTKELRTRSHKRDLRVQRVTSINPLPAFLAVMILSSSIAYVGSLQAGTLLSASNSNMNPGVDWLFQKSSGKISVLSDINTLGKALVVRSSIPGGSFDDLSVQVYDSQRYTDLVRPNYTGQISVGNNTSAPTYVVVDAITAFPVASKNWLSFEPLSRHISDIQNNTQLSQVYDDGTCLVEVWYSG